MDDFTSPFITYVADNISISEEPHSPNSLPTQQNRHQTGTTFETKQNSPPSRIKERTLSAAALTNENLAEHTCQQTRLWADAKGSSELRQRQSDKIADAARSLEIDLSDLSEPILGNMVQRLDGMTPLERFFSDKNNRWIGKDIAKAFIALSYIGKEAVYPIVDFIWT